MSSSPRKTFIVSLRSQRVDVQCPFLTWPRGGKKPREKTASGHDSVFITLESSREKNKRGRAGSFPLASLYLISTTKDQTSYALTPNTVELIPTLGALFPRSGPVQDPVLTTSPGSRWSFLVEEPQSSEKDDLHPREVSCESFPRPLDLREKSEMIVLVFDTAIESALKSVAKTRKLCKVAQIYPYRATSLVRNRIPP